MWRCDEDLEIEGLILLEEELLGNYESSKKACKGLIEYESQTALIIK